MCRLCVEECMQRKKLENCFLKDKGQFYKMAYLTIVKASKSFEDIIVISQFVDPAFSLRET